MPTVPAAPTTVNTPRGDKFVTEPLVSREIAGVLCDGLRITMTKLSGASVVSESWTARDLRITIESEVAGVRLKTIKLSRDEPDPMLFRPPESDDHSRQPNPR